MASLDKVDEGGLGEVAILRDVGFSADWLRLFVPVSCPEVEKREKRHFLLRLDGKEVRCVVLNAIERILASPFFAC